MLRCLQRTLIDGILCVYFAAIKREISIHHFIVVDGYSTDRTIDVIREFFGDKVVVKTNASLGGARYISMKTVNSE